MTLKKSILITHALKEEFIPLNINGCDITQIITGVGKTKSAYILTKSICRNKPDLVLNIGTAGTLKHQVGDVFISTHFIDRDYEVIRLPGLEHEINAMPFLDNHLQLKQWINSYKNTGTCNTGDSFITKAESIKGDVIDMEAYAQAFVCKEFQIPFISIKYVTDIIGENSVELWESRLAQACEHLTLWFEQHKILSLVNS
jgi:adenosylhomocysteine nucleosidase